MAAAVPARLTPAQGLRFALTVGTAFVLLGAIAWWRDHPNMAIALGGLGSSLVVAGLLAPTRLGPIEKSWMSLARAISRVTTPIVMGVIYLLVVSPVALGRRALGGNPLVHEAVRNSYWRSRPEGKRAGNLRRQF